jgi:cytochrome P450
MSLEDTTLCNGKYECKKGQFMVIQNICAQRDPKLWGDDVSRLDDTPATESDQLPG